MKKKELKKKLTLETFPELLLMIDECNNFFFILIRVKKIFQIYF